MSIAIDRRFSSSIRDASREISGRYFSVFTTSICGNHCLAARYRIVLCLTQHCMHIQWLASDLFGFSCSRKIVNAQSMRWTLCTHVHMIVPTQTAWWLCTLVCDRRKARDVLPSSLADKWIKRLCHRRVAVCLFSRLPIWRTHGKSNEFEVAAYLTLEPLQTAHPIVQQCGSMINSTWRWIIHKIAATNNKNKECWWKFCRIIQHLE